jgi:integrase
MKTYPKTKRTKDPNNLHLYVKDVRILTVKEYEDMKNAIPKDSHKTIFEIMMVTGMRYIEVQRLHDHQEWYNEKKNLIHLPTEAQKKVKRRQLERTIHPLPSMFNHVLKSFWSNERPPATTTWDRDVKRWAELADINPFGISAKVTRKTLESWTIAAGMIESTVCLRQGHDSLTSMRHYQGLAFSDDELRDIKKQLTAWGLLK